MPSHLHPSTTSRDRLFDTRTFHPSRHDIDKICNFFSIGKLLHYETEKNTTTSHSNFFVFAQTNRGQYALKFYPPQTSQAINVEYALNRLLLHHDFPTPAMHAGRERKPFLASNRLLACCYTYIKGEPAWKYSKNKNTLRQINAGLLSLKNILSSKKRLRFLRQEDLTKTIKAMAADSRALEPYDQQELIQQSLLSAAQTYQEQGRLFTRRVLHNNASLNNFIVTPQMVYTLDLSHVREDFELSDLSSLLISCFFLNAPITSIKAIIKNYFTAHHMSTDHFAVLDVLIKIGLIKEYLKDVRRIQSVTNSSYPKTLINKHLSHLRERQKSILKNINSKNNVFYPAKI